MKILRPHSSITKTIAFFLSLYFILFSSISYSHARELGDVNALYPSPEESHVQIPEELGRISESYFTTVSIPGREKPRKSANTFVVHIQDAHGQLSAQKNIGKILEHLVQKYGFDTLFLEGGLEGPISPDLLRFFGEDSVNEKIADDLLKEARIGGPDVFLLKAKGKVRAYGVERAELYRENLAAFRNVLLRKKESDTFLSGLKSQIEYFGSCYFNPDLKKFLKEWLSVQENRQEILSHLDILDQYAKKQLKMDLHQSKNQFEYPQLVRYFAIQEFQRRFEGGNVQNAMAKEKKKLDEWLAEKQFDPIYSQVFESLLNYSFSPLNVSYPVDVRLFLERFYAAAKPKGFNFGLYSYFMRHLGMMLLAQELEPEAFFEEIKKLNVEIIKSLAKTPEENSLARLMRDYTLVKKLFSLQLSRDEYSEIKQKEKIISPAMLVARLRMLENEKIKASVDSNSENDLFKETLHFYALAQEREDHMFSSILSVLDEKSVKKAILVTGGFHTPGLATLMRDKGFSFLEVTPRMTDLESNEKYMNQILLGSAKASTVPQLSPAKIAVPVIEKQIGEDAARFEREGLEAAIRKEAEGKNLTFGPGLEIQGLEKRAASLGHRSIDRLKLGEFQTNRRPKADKPRNNDERFPAPIKEEIGELEIVIGAYETLVDPALLRFAINEKELNVLDEQSYYDFMNKTGFFAEGEGLMMKLGDIEKRIKEAKKEFKSRPSAVELLNYFSQRVEKIKESGQVKKLDRFYNKFFSRNAKANQSRAKRLKEIQEILKMKDKDFGIAIELKGKGIPDQLKVLRKGTENVDQEYVKKAEELLVTQKNNQAPSTSTQSASSLGAVQFQMIFSLLIPDAVKQWVRHLIFSGLEKRLKRLVARNPISEKPSREEYQKFARLASKTIRRWVARNQFKLKYFLPFFLNYPVAKEEYQRNRAGGTQQFGIYSHVWSANGGQSRIHNHAGQWGFTVPLAGGFVEKRYELNEAPGPGAWDKRIVEMDELDSLEPEPGRVSAIPRGRGSIHQVINHSPLPGVMIEIYFWLKKKPPTRVNNFIPVDGNKSFFYVRNDSFSDLIHPAHVLLKRRSQEIQLHDFKKRMDLDQVKFPIYTTEEKVIVHRPQAEVYLSFRDPKVFLAQDGSYLFEPRFPSAVSEESAASLGEIFKTPYRKIQGKRVNVLERVMSESFGEEEMKALLKDLEPLPLKIVPLDPKKKIYTAAEVEKLSQLSEDQQRARGAILALARKGDQDGFHGAERPGKEWLIPTKEADAYLNALNVIRAASEMGVSNENLGAFLDTPNGKKMWKPRQFGSRRLIPIEVVEKFRNKKPHLISSRLVWKSFKKAGLKLSLKKFKRLIKDPKRDLIENNVYGRPGRVLLMDIENVWKLYREVKKVREEVSKKITLKEAEEITGLSHEDMIILIRAREIKAAKYSLFTPRPNMYLLDREEAERIKAALLDPEENARLRQLIQNARSLISFEGSIKALDRIQSPLNLAMILESLEYQVEFYRELFEQADAEERLPSVKDFKKLEEGFGMDLFSFSEVHKRIQFWADFVERSKPEWQEELGPQIDALLREFGTKDKPSDLARSKKHLDEIYLLATKGNGADEKKKRGKELEAIQARSGLNVEEFGKRVNPRSPKSKWEISQMEQGEREISDEFLERARRLAEKEQGHRLREAMSQSRLSVADFQARLGQPVGRILAERQKMPGGLLTKAEDITRTERARILRSSRELAGVSQTEFANEIGGENPKSNSSISLMEMGDKNYPVTDKELDRAVEVARVKGAERLAAAQKESGIEQREFAKLLEMTPYRFWKIVAAKETPSFETLIKAETIAHEKKAERLREEKEDQVSRERNAKVAANARDREKRSLKLRELREQLDLASGERVPVKDLQDRLGREMSSSNSEAVSISKAQLLGWLAGRKGFEDEVLNAARRLVGREVKRLRELTGLSPAALGERLGISRRFIQFVENGEKILQTSMIEKLRQLTTDAPSQKMKTLIAQSRRDTQSFAELLGIDGKDLSLMLEGKVSASPDIIRRAGEMVHQERARIFKSSRELSGLTLEEFSREIGGEKPKYPASISRMENGDKSQSISDEELDRAVQVAKVKAGERLVSAREKLDYGKDRFAKFSGVSGSALAKMLDGTKAIPAELLLKAEEQVKLQERTDRAKRLTELKDKLALAAGEKISIRNFATRLNQHRPSVDSQASPVSTQMANYWLNGNRTPQDWVLEVAQNVLGEEVKSLRERSGLSRAELGKRLGLTQQYIGQVELGKKEAQESLIMKLRELADANGDAGQNDNGRADEAYSLGVARELVNGIFRLAPKMTIKIRDPNLELKDEAVVIHQANFYSLVDGMRSRFAAGKTMRGAA